MSFRHICLSLDIILILEMEEKIGIDHDIIKDAICEADPSVDRKSIVFERIYVQDGAIKAPYRELAWSSKFSIGIGEYEARKREKKLRSIGI